MPVGEDQRQHLELSRDLAGRFNSRFGEVFVVPKPYILKETAKVYDLQQVDKQMSKSIGGSGCLWLLDDPKVIEKKIRSAVTDTGREVVFDPDHKPGVSNLIAILSAMSGESTETIEERFTGRGYGDLKKEVAAAVLDWIVPFQDRVTDWMSDPAGLDAVLDRGASHAEQTGSEVLAKVWDAVGFLPVR